ncbi:MAG: hypothetical protein IJQ72_04310 [Bacilli bacterium]|nr:hypothetical protein [Bacilli bacterium]
MERWFSKLDFLTQAILLILPFIGYLIEIGVRIFAVVRLHSKKNIAGLVIFVLVGWAILFNIIDIFVLSRTDDLMLIE